MKRRGFLGLLAAMFVAPVRRGYELVIVQVKPGRVRGLRDGWTAVRHPTLNLLGANQFVGVMDDAGFGFHPEASECAAQLKEWPPD